MSRGRLTVWLFGRALAEFDVEWTTAADDSRTGDVAKPEPEEKPTPDPEPEPDPSTYRAGASTPRLAETRLPADPDPIDRFGFGFGPRPADAR